MSRFSNACSAALLLVAGMVAPVPCLAAPPTAPAVAPSTYELPSAGPRDAPVTMVLFADFQCPFCARSTKVVRELQQRYAGDLRVLFVHRPLRFRSQAEPAARAAWAAWQQGAFWPMFDKLMAEQANLGAGAYRRWARRLGLDVDRFTRDMGSKAAGDRIARDRYVARTLGISGTPGFLINGRKLAGFKPLATFTRIIDDELAQARVALQGGVDRNDLHAERVRANLPTRAGRYISWLVRGKQPPIADVAPSSRRRRPDADTLWKVPLSRVDGRLGSADGLVKMVIFTDYQCPFCGRLDKTVQRLVRELPQLEVRIKHLPLSFHKDAHLAARAAVCAGKQGRFAAMHKALFADQRRLKRPDLLRRATTLGLRLTPFGACLDSPAAYKVVESNIKQARVAGARGTPNSFINGRKLIGAQPYKAVKLMVQERLSFAPAELARYGKLTMKAAGKAAPRRLYAALQRHAKAAASAKKPAKSAKKHTFATAGRPSLGNRKAKDAAVVVFLELSCPFCTRLLPTLLKLSRKRPKIRIAVLQFPLSSRCNPHVSTDMHPTACRGAAWAEAARAQRRFPGFLAAAAKAGTLTGRRPRHADKALLTMARGAGLNLRRLNRFVARGKHRAGIAADIALARAAGVRGTPTIFVHGRRIKGARNLARLLTLVDAGP